MKVDRGLVLVVSGPSGSGKSSIIEAVRKEHPEIIYSVSATTREPRDGEINGVHYFFKSDAQFRFMLEHDGFLEWVNYCDNLYGTPREFVEESINSGKDIIIEVDVPGAINIKNSLVECVLIFILPPSFEDLKNRIEQRGAESEEAKFKRLNTALSEVSRAHEYNYIITNDDFETAKNQFLNIILAEKSKFNRSKNKVEKLLMEGLKYEGIKA